MSLHNTTLFITGASRGIGREIALKAAADGANIVIAAKSATAHPKLQGTIFSVAEEIEQAGGQALPLQLDVRDQHAVATAMQQAAAHFGGIDILINNAGAINLTGVADIDPQKFDLIYQVNTRATLVCSQAALPYLKKSANPHILSLSPPLNMDPKWFAAYAPYTLSKYGMSMLTIGMNQEFANFGIAVNSLWPRHIIATAAIEHAYGGAAMLKYARQPRIMAEAAYYILTRQQRELSGQLLIDEEILSQQGISDFEQYRYAPGDEPLMIDLFVEA